MADKTGCSPTNHHFLAFKTNKHVATYKPQPCSSESHSSVRNVNCHIATNRYHLVDTEHDVDNSGQCGRKACGLNGALGLNTIRGIDEWLRCGDAWLRPLPRMHTYKSLRTAERILMKFGTRR